jgi:hypothetical protein
MRDTLDFIRDVSESWVRAVFHGDVTRPEAKARAEADGHSRTTGAMAHRLIRAHDDIESFIVFYQQQAAYATEIEQETSLDGNTSTTTLHYPNGQPPENVDQLLARHGIDTEEWEQKWKEVNSWPTTISEDGGLYQVRNPQIKVKYQRTELEPEFPVPEPVQIDAGSARPKGPEVTASTGPAPEGWETTLVLMDRHYGFEREERTGDLIPTHDRRAIDLAEQIAAEAQPDRIVDIGDCLDFASISDYLEPPTMKRLLEPAYTECAVDTARIAEAAQPSEGVIFLEGNHDERLQETMQAEAPELWGLRDVDGIQAGDPPLMSLPGLMNFSRHGWTFVGGYPDAELRLNDGLICRHGNTARSKSGMTVKKILQDQTAEHSTVIGHIHRRESASYTNWKGDRARTFFAACFGCLCRTDGIMEGVKARQNWQQGLALLHTDPGGWKHVAEPIEVYPTADEASKEAWFRGRRYRAREPDLEALSAETGIRYTRSRRPAA